MSSTPAWLESILEEHFDELGMLWEMRQSSFRDPDFDAETVLELDSRIEPHIDALVLGGEHSLPILAGGLDGDDPAIVFAASYVLMRMENQEAADLVIAATREAADGQIDGLCEALRQSNLDLVANSLRELYNDGSVAAAAVAAEVLAASGSVAREPSRLADFYMSEDPGVRRAGWRITSLLELQ